MVEDGRYDASRSLDEEQWILSRLCVMSPRRHPCALPNIVEVPHLTYWHYHLAWLVRVGL